MTAPPALLREPAPERSQRWRLDALCLGQDPVYWDAGDDDAAPFREDEDDAWTRAGLACLGCPVKRACALDAIATEATHTIRAGVPLQLAERSPHQARKVVNRLRRAAGLGSIREEKRTA